MNEPPIIPDKSYGFGRRLIVLNFMRRFEKDEIDPQLDAKLEKEKDGIFYWALMGLGRLLKQGGFDICDEVEEETTALITTMNPMMIFIEEECEFGDQRAVKPMLLYRRYKDWCKENGHRPMARNRFNEQIIMNFPQVDKKLWGPKRHTYYVGMDLKSEYEKEL
jgi:putative DNA primase/helicase